MPKYKLGEDPVFIFSLPGGVRTPVPVNYATYQVHSKHEQPHVLLPDSHVTIRTIQQTQDAASVY